MHVLETFEIHRGEKTNYVAQTLVHIKIVGPKAYSDLPKIFEFRLSFDVARFRLGNFAKNGA